MLIEILKPDFSFEDGRGSLVQLAHAGYSQINVVRSYKGSVRGGHYHARTGETFYVVEGSFAVTAERDGEREERDFKAGDMFRFPENVVHSFCYNEDTLLVAMYETGVENPDGSKDIIPKSI